jgi:hypothetical protein
MEKVKKIYRGKIGLEDLFTGEGTFIQTRNGQLVTLTKINAGNLPFDEATTLAEQVTLLKDNYPNITIVVDNVASVVAVAGEIGDVVAVNAELTAITSVNTELLKVVEVANTVVPNIDEILAADDNATIATENMYHAIAAKLTTISYATQPVDENVIEYTSNGDGTYTETVTSTYSALHWKTKAEAIVTGTGVVTEDGTQTLTNKTLDDISNYIGANHIHYPVRNESGSTIPRGTVITGSSTQPGTDYIEVVPVTDPQTQVALGITHAELANNGIGLVTNTGLVLDDVDTSGWTVGTILYPNTSGGFTSTKPTSGVYQACAVVTRSHANNGTLLVEFTEPKEVFSASNMGITDAGNYWDSTNLEDFTQEVGLTFQNLRTATPTLSGVTEGIEGGIYVITITNHSTTATYTINVEAGSYTRSGNTINWTLPAFTGVDDIHNLTVEAQEDGDLPSGLGTHTITVLDIESDQTILYEGATINSTTFPTVTNVDLSGNTILATADGAVATSAVVEQDGGDTDFVNAVPTMDSKAIGFTVEAGATNTSVTVSGQTLTPTVLLNDGESVDLIKFDTTGNVTINGADGSTNTSTTDAVPTMTSDTSPSGLVIYSSQDVSSGRQGYKAFADDANTGFWATNVTTTGFLGYGFTTTKVINKYIVLGGGNLASKAPKDWTVEGNNDTTDGSDGTWDTLSTVTNETSWDISTARTYTFTNSTPYKFYRLNITANNGDVGYLAIGELKFIGTTITQTLDLTSLSLTNAPTQVLKDVPTLSTSIVASGEPDSFVERTPQTFTADTDGTYNNVVLANKGTNITLSNGDLTFASSSTAQTENNVFSQLITEGDIYCEVTLDTAVAWGVGVSTVVTQADIPSDFSTGYYVCLINGNKYNNASNASYTTAFAQDDIVGIRYMHSTGELRFYKNGADLGVAYTLPAGTDVYFAMTGYNNTATVNFGMTPFNNQPSGTTALSYDNSATEITTLFDADTRSGRDVKHKVELNNGDEVSRIQTPISKLGV